jgi:polyisoprenoid-binding protein YceI
MILEYNLIGSLKMEFVMTTWKLDHSHSEIKFKARHLLVSSVTGEFREFDGKVVSEDDNFNNADIYFEADVNSIDTKNDQRDSHLKSEDFFNAGKFPKLIFESKKIEKVKEDKYKVVGDLSIRGITKEIILDVTHIGTTTGLGNTTVAGFEISGKVNRFDYGLKWNALTETGGVIVGEEIRIEINAELVKEEVFESVES